MLLPQFPGMTVDLAYAGKSYTAPALPDGARKVSLDRPPVACHRSRDRPAGRHPSTTHQAKAWKRHTRMPAGRRTGSRVRVRSYGNARRGTRKRRPSSPGRMRRRRHIGTSGPHVGCDWVPPQYKSIFRSGGGQIGTRPRSPAATICSASTYARREGRGPVAVWAGRRHRWRDACNRQRRIPCATWDAALCVANRGAGI
jgi:hypothetical protein